MSNCTRPKSGPQLKLTKACVLRYNDPCCTSLNSQECCQPPPPCNSCVKPCIKLPGAIKDVSCFETKVGKLRRKLNETNCNLSTLRAFVCNTLDEITTQCSNSSEETEDLKDPAQTARDIKELLCIIQDFEDHNKVVMERGMDCVKLIEKLDTTSACACGPASPSIEAIKSELKEIKKEQEILDKRLEEDAGIVMAKVQQSCSLILCPRKKTETDSTTSGGKSCSHSYERSNPRVSQTSRRSSNNSGNTHSSGSSRSKGKTRNSSQPKN